MTQGLVKRKSGVADLPALFAPTPDAARWYVEFFTVNIRNPNTRRAYARVAADFAAWCETNGVGAHSNLTSRMVSAVSTEGGGGPSLKRANRLSTCSALGRPDSSASSTATSTASSPKDLSYGRWTEKLILRHDSTPTGEGRSAIRQLTV